MRQTVILMVLAKHQNPQSSNDLIFWATSTGQSYDQRLFQFAADGYASQ